MDNGFRLVLEKWILPVIHFSQRIRLDKVKVADLDGFIRANQFIQVTKKFGFQTDGNGLQAVVLCETIILENQFYKEAGRLGFGWGGWRFLTGVTASGRGVEDEQCGEGCSQAEPHDGERR